MKKMLSKGLIVGLVLHSFSNSTFAKLPQTNNTLPSSHTWSYLPSKDAFTHGHAVFQLGGYWSRQGKAQHINIED